MKRAKATKPGAPTEVQDLTEEEIELALQAAKSHLEMKRLNKYKSDRAQAYIQTMGHAEDQLDFIYRNGIKAWKAKIKEIKDRYPKPEEE